MQSGKLTYIGYVLLQSFFYALCNPLTKIAYRSISPLWLLAIRFSVAAALCTAFWGKKMLHEVRRLSPSVWLGSSLCCAGAFIAGNLALEYASATNVGFIISLSFLFTPFFSFVAMQRKIKLGQIALQMVTVLGMFLLCCNGGQFSFGLGELLALGNALFLAGLLAFGESASKRMSIWSVTTLQIYAAAVFCGLFALAFGGNVSQLYAVTWDAWLILLYQILCCTLAAYYLQNVAVKHLSAVTVSAVQCTQPIITVGLSWLMLDESLSTTGLIGAGIIMGCLLLDSVLSKKHGKLI